MSAALFDRPSVSRLALHFSTAVHMLLLGIVGRSLGQLFAAGHAFAWYSAAGSSCLEVVAIGCFVGVISITSVSTVASVLDRYPDLIDTFVAYGFKMLSNPRLRRSIARVVTIEQACRRMDVDCGQFIEALNRRLREIQTEEVTQTNHPQHDSCCQSCAARAGHVD